MYSLRHNPTRMTLLRGWPVVCLLLGALLLLLQPVVAQDSGQLQVRQVEIEGTITPPMASYVDRAIESAENDNVNAVVLQIDTPGGLSTAMDDIVSSILESEVPVIAWVGPSNARAASAGVYITYATHIASMAPNTNIGSASPVQLGGDGSDEEQSTSERKAMNDAVARIENLARLRDRNVDWAISAVRDADNITSNTALDIGVIDVMAPDIDTLLRDVHGMEVELASGETVTLETEGANVSTTSMNVIERFLQLISDPTIAYLLLSFGSLGIFLELSNPGGFIPGIIGVVCFILGFYALGTLPVNWTGVLLIALAFGLFFLDLFVTSFGTLLIGGLAAFVVGSYMLIDESVPGYEGVAPPVIWTSAALVLATAVVIGTLVLKTMRSKPTTGRNALVGEIAEVRTALSPDGMVYIEGEHWSATADGLAEGETIPAGRYVEVIAVEGLRLEVRATSKTPEAWSSGTSRRESIVPSA